MFCYKCGQQLPDNSKFCSNCGAQINNTISLPFRSISNINIGQIKFDTTTIICLVISVVMLLSMLVLPTFILGPQNIAYAISFLGDDYMPYHSVRTEINTLSRIAFIFVLASTAACVIFRITKKIFFSFLTSCINAGVLFFYNVSIIGILISDDRTASIGAGNVLCIVCSIALFIFTYLAFSKEKKDNRIASTTPQPMIFR